MNFVTQFFQIWMRITGWAIRLIFDLLAKLIQAVFVSLNKTRVGRPERDPRAFNHPKHWRLSPTPPSKKHRRHKRKRYRS